MSDTFITASWFDDIDSGPGVWKIAQVTLSHDAFGTITGSTYDLDTGGMGYLFSFIIANGEIIPEPATLLLLAAGRLALIRRRANRCG